MTLSVIVLGLSKIPQHLCKRTAQILNYHRPNRERTLFVTGLAAFVLILATVGGSVETAARALQWRH